MRKPKLSAIKRIMLRARENPSLIFMGFAFCLLIATYLVSKHQDAKVITYQNKVDDLSTSRVITRNNDIYRRKDKIYTNYLQELEEKIAKLSSQLEGIQEDSKEVPPKNASKRANNQVAQENTASALPAPRISPPPRDFDSTIVTAPQPTARTAKAHMAARKRPKRKGPSVISFPVQKKAPPADMGIKIPSGSFVKAKLLTGIEAPEGRALPALLQADYAFIGPNKSRVDLTGCFLIAKSTGNLSIERVEMQATKISCVAKSGRAFERKMNGYVADGKDNSFAVMGTVNSKRDRVAAMAFLSSVVSGIGKAVSSSQTKTISNSARGSTTEITGSHGRFIAANGASNAANTITSWYLKHAEQLLPTINVGSGQEVWIIIQDSVSLPNWYFKRQFDQYGGVSFLSNLLQ